MTLDEQLNLIYDTVSRYLMIDNPFVSNYSYAYKTARDLIRYIIKEGYPHLVKRYAESRKVKVSSVYHQVSSFSKKLKYDVYLKTILDNIADDLQNDAIRVRNYSSRGKSATVESKTPTHTKILFGFDYTPKEICERYATMRKASIWFEKEYM